MSNIKISKKRGEYSICLKYRKNSIIINPNNNEKTILPSTFFFVYQPTAENITKNIDDELANYIGEKLYNQKKNKNLFVFIFYLLNQKPF